MSDIAKLVVGGTDKERAEKYRDDLMPHLTAIADLLTAARRDSLVIGFQMSPPDAFGRVSIAMLDISKKLV